jgi:hypothetical protein
MHDRAYPCRNLIVGALGDLRLPITLSWSRIWIERLQECFLEDWFDSQSPTTFETEPYHCTG